MNQRTHYTPDHAMDHVVVSTTRCGCKMGAVPSQTVAEVMAAAAVARCHSSAQLTRPSIIMALLSTHSNAAYGAGWPSRCMEERGSEVARVYAPSRGLAPRHYAHWHAMTSVTKHAGAGSALVARRASAKAALAARARTQWPPAQPWRTLQQISF